MSGEMDPWTVSTWDGHVFEQDEEACGQCHFWERFKGGDQGLCRRHAPRASSTFDEISVRAQIKQGDLLMSDFAGRDENYRADPLECRREAFWPTTSNYDWCGEWKHFKRKRELPE